MTDLRQANIDALGHLVAIRDLIVQVGVPATQHVAAFDENHRDHDLATDFLLVARAYLDRFNTAINRLDPNAAPATLDTAPTAPDHGGVMVGDNLSGVMLMGDELEAHRTQRIGQVAAHAREAITARFTSDEAVRRQALHSQSLAAQGNAAPPLTDTELDELHALDADHDWAVNTRDHADALVDALLAAGDGAALDAVNLEDGWP